MSGPRRRPPENLTRRQFLAAGAAAGLAALGGLGPAAPGEAGPAASPGGAAPSPSPGAPPPPPLVVDARDPAWRQGGRPDPEAIRRLLDRGLLRLTGRADAPAAWAALFRPKERVLVKFNRLSYDYTGANQALVGALAAGLLSAGIARERIFVAEAEGASFPGGGRADTSFVREYRTPFGPTRLTRLIEEQVDAVLNVPNLKDHATFGLTCALKNISHAGGTLMEGPGRFHQTGHAEVVPALFSLPPLRGKLRLTVANALKAVCNGGPGPKPQFTWNHDGLLLGTDPVALDRVALELVEAERQRRGLPGLFRRRSRPAYIQRAGELGLGVADLRRINWVRLDGDQERPGPG